MHGEIENSLRRNLRDKEYAEGYAESFLNSFIATQIKVLREQREMTQAELGSMIGTTQGGISRYENIDYSSWNIRSLIKMARAFDVRLKVSFEPFGTLPDEVVRFDRDFLERVPREKDPGLLAAVSVEDLRCPLGNVVDIAFYKGLQTGEKANKPPEPDRDNEEEWRSAIWK